MVHYFHDPSMKPGTQQKIQNREKGMEEVLHELSIVYLFPGYDFLFLLKLHCKLTKEKMEE